MRQIAFESQLSALQHTLGFIECKSTHGLYIICPDKVEISFQKKPFTNLLLILLASRLIKIKIRHNRLKNKSAMII